MALLHGALVPNVPGVFQMSRELGSRMISKYLKKVKQNGTARHQFGRKRIHPIELHLFFRCFPKLLRNMFVVHKHSLPGCRPRLEKKSNNKLSG